jgi:glycyl-tRNA synthetase
MKEYSDENKVSMKDIIELCKRRGFIFHSTEIYGGIQGVYDYGPLGVELKNNLKAQWWNDLVYERNDIEGIDASILTHRLTLKYSGHEDTFYDPLVDCKDCKSRLRQDHIKDNKCSNCGSVNLTVPRNFNLMFKCNFGAIEEEDNFVYLRPETAQSIFINFKNILSTTSQKIPFGVAQIGKVFRNEITARNFIFRTREFEQMELEFFVNKEDAPRWYEYWKEQRYLWWIKQGLNKENLKLAEIHKNDLAHYSLSTCDILYKYTHGFDELEGIANRGDFDLIAHSKNVRKFTGNLKEVFNANSQHTVPYVIEPSAGVDRGIMALLTEAYHKEFIGDGNIRIVLKIAKHLAPIKFAVIPLARNNKNIVNKAKELALLVSKLGVGRVRYEDTANIGKAYRRNDEIGTPFCITVDFNTLSDDTVTIRDRDTMIQKRIEIKALLDMIHNKKIYSTVFN